MNQTTLYSPVLAKIGAERGSKNLSDLTAQLRDTSYQEQLVKISLPLTSRKLERSFRENLISTYLKIIKNSPKNASKYLQLYLLRFEVENIKALIKATNAKLSPEEKLNKIYLSPEDYLKNRSVMEETAKASTIKQITKTLKKTDYVTTLNMGLQSYEEDGSTTCLDVLIDKTFYEKLHDTYESLPQKENHTHISIQAQKMTALHC
ncbi:MAG: V-type ATPase subunit [Candidatus Bathyarchaeia archaeon]